MFFRWPMWQRLLAWERRRRWEFSSMSLELNRKSSTCKYLPRFLHTFDLWSKYLTTTAVQPLTKPNIYQLTQRTWAARSKSQTQLQETSIFWGFLICQKSFGATNFKMKWELLKNWHDPWKSCWISLKWFLSCGKSIMYLTSSTWPGEGKLENGTVWDVLQCSTTTLYYIRHSLRWKQTISK